ncbi:MAG: hypothetical protein D6820_02175, partial [Lentisphaerae bacterium]
MERNIEQMTEHDFMLNDNELDDSRETRVSTSGIVATESIQDFRILFGGLFESYPGPVVVWNPRMHVATVNRLWGQLFCIPDDHIVGGDIDNYEQLLAKAIADNENVLRMLRHAREANGAISRVVIHVLPSGNREERYLEWRVNTIEEGLLQGFKVESMVDVSDRIASQREFHQIQKNLVDAQRLQTVGTLAAGIMHDLNNVLSIISGYTQMISINPNNSEKYVSQISRSCEIMARILEEASEFANARPSNMCPCNLGKLINDTRDLVRHAISKRIEIQWQIEEATSSLKANPNQLIQLLFNLCFNAAEAIEGRGTISVRLNTVDHEKVRQFDPPANIDPAQAEQWMMLSVSDTGCGM